MSKQSASQNREREKKRKSIPQSMLHIRVMIALVMLQCSITAGSQEAAFVMRSGKNECFVDC
jgi:hypothetical protein